MRPKLNMASWNEVFVISVALVVHVTAQGTDVGTVFLMNNTGFEYLGCYDKVSVMGNTSTTTDLKDITLAWCAEFCQGQDLDVAEIGLGRAPGGMYARCTCVLSHGNETQSGCLTTCHNWQLPCGDTQKRHVAVYVDINECDDHPSVCGSDSAGVCTNHLGGYQCNCRDGFRLCHANHTCEDVNECDEHPSVCGRSGAGVCTNHLGSYHCNCSEGYRLSHDNHTCEDIHEYGGSIVVFVVVCPVILILCVLAAAIYIAVKRKLQTDARQTPDQVQEMHPTSIISSANGAAGDSQPHGQSTPIAIYMNIDSHQAYISQQAAKQSSVNQAAESDYVNQQAVKHPSVNQVAESAYANKQAVKQPSVNQVAESAYANKQATEKSFVNQDSKQVYVKPYVVDSRDDDSHEYEYVHGRAMTLDNPRHVYQPLLLNQ